MCCNGIRWYKWFQSTLPQGKWPLVTRINGFSLQISIHTSAREVTYKRKAKDEASRFQSTLPQGKWRKSFWTKLCNLSYFNPHFRKGSDFSAFSIVFCSSISIHTSAREVTDILIRPQPCHKFQYTLPQGKWRILCWWCFCLINFNPHFRKGSDCGVMLLPIVFMISIHTSAREVTMSSPALLHNPGFQNTLTQWNRR